MSEQVTEPDQQPGWNEDEGNLTEHVHRADMIARDQLGDGVCRWLSSIGTRTPEKFVE